MIILLGSTGYVGGAFQRLLLKHGVQFQSLSRSEIDYTCPKTLREFISSAQPEFLINAAGYTGKPNVDACEIHKKECLDGNAVFPGTIRSVCEEFNLPWGHVSSGCIYTGRRPDGEGFREDDEPNFTFRQNNCSWYSGTKALGEEVLQGASNCFIWRLRIPFDNQEGPRNYLTKLMQYDNLLEAENSISNLDEFVKASWETWEKKIPFGRYNVTNPGHISTRQVAEWINESGVCKKDFNYFTSEEHFLKNAAKTPRSNCVMDSTKLASKGIQMKPVEQSIKEALANWQT
jgi:dTDP-4-dehydrorhamnose reductase